MVAQAKESEEALGPMSRVIRLLQFVAEHRGFTLKLAAERLELPPSSLHRMLQLLLRMDLVERDGQGGYRTSREYFRLGSLAVGNFDLHGAAHPHLQAIMAAFGETCSFALYLPATRQGTIVETLPTAHPLQYRIELFAAWSLAWGALGRAMLPYLSEAELDAVLAGAEPSPALAAPVPTRRALAPELAEVRTSGHYVSINQNVLGATGTAAPVLGAGGRLVGSLGLTVPLARYDPARQAEIAGVVTRQARALSASLGHRADLAA